jgi:hypothetical protein
MLKAINKHDLSILYVHKKLLLDRNFILAAVKANGKCFYHINK